MSQAPLPQTPEAAASDDRLTALEIKASYTEDLLDELDKVVARQQLQIEALIREVRALRERQPEAVPGMARNLRDELPPHY